MYPCVVGHEMVGVVVRVGSQVRNIRLGDRVGVGAQSESCLGRNKPKGCEMCSQGLEQYCDDMVSTYDGRHLNGGIAYGGHARYKRVPSHFAIKIPDELNSAYAAPMLCAGITMYSPLHYHGCKADMKVGIVGLGGLGHFGVLFAKAMDAKKVVAISRKAEKRGDAIKMGADMYVATDDDQDWVAQNRGSLDLIISTVSSAQVSSELLPRKFAILTSLF
jgi:alcohol dehydrogenase (NADP+)